MSYIEVDATAAVQVALYEEALFRRAIFERSGKEGYEQAMTSPWLMSDERMPLEAKAFIRGDLDHDTFRALCGMPEDPGTRERLMQALHEVNPGQDHPLVKIKVVP